jgi:hypothetical protein
VDERKPGGRLNIEKSEKNRGASAPDDSVPEVSPPAPEDFETRPEFAAVIAAVRACEPELPPEGFTAGVMAALAGERRRKQPGRLESVWRRQLVPRLRSLTDTASSREIAGCFLLAAFFYFVLGGVLLFGFHRLGPLVTRTGWLALQPRLALAFAAGLAVMGLLIRNGGDRAVRTAYAGLRLYIVVVAANALGLQLSHSLPFGFMGGLFLSAGMILVGAFLAAAVHRYRRQLAATPADAAP